MLNIDIAKAKDCFSDLINLAIRGDEVVITKKGQPVAKLTALAEKHKKKRQFGSARGLIKMADDFDETPEDFRDYV